MSLFVFGDSHVEYSFKGIETSFMFKNSLSIHDFTSKQHYLFEQDVVYFLKEFIKSVNEDPKYTFLIICLGEIDTRCLINKQIVEKKRDEDEVIENLAINLLLFFNFLKTAIDDKSQCFKQIWFMSIVPTSEDKDFGHEYNQRGSCADRIRYTEKLNKNIKEKICDDKCFHFFDIYNLYINENGTMKKELSNNGDVHIHDNELFIDKLLEDLSTITGQKFVKKIEDTK